MTKMARCLSLGLFIFCISTLTGCKNSNSMQPPPGPPPLTIAPTSPPDGITGQSYSVTLQVSGGTSPFTLTETTNPPAFPSGQGASGTPCQGLAINLSTGAISGTPANAGNCAFSVRATDSSSPQMSLTANLMIRIAAPLAISTASLPNGADNASYSATVSATGGLAPLNFSISAGALPAGLALTAASGAISGAPTAGGSFTFTVQVQDSLSPKQSATKQYTVLILKVTTATLPNGTIGAAYNQSLAATGGSGNLSWALAAGSGPLPPGLSLSAAGVISGTPTGAGTANFTVQVTDSGAPARTDTQALSITINNPVPAITLLNPSSALAGDPAFTLTVTGSSFVSGATVLWNGSSRTTTFVDSTQVTASIPASDVATAGTAQVQVSNPAPGGGTSNMLAFTINAAPNPVPTLTSLSPPSATAGGPAFTLTANGTNFVSNSIVRWNGSDRTTTFVSATQLTASVAAADIASTGSASVTVFNPIPSGGTSNAITFIINPAPQPAGVLERVSVSSSGAEGNFNSVLQGAPSVSADGRWVVFDTGATNFVANDPNGSGSDVFLRDRQTGQTTLVSVGSDGTTGCLNGTGQRSSITPNGRFITWEFAGGCITGMPPNPNGIGDIYLRDRDVDGNGVYDEPNTGAQEDHVRVFQVSLTPSGTEPNGDSRSVSVSSNGRFVAFESFASDLVAGDTNSQSDIFVVDTCIGAPGCTPSIERVSVDSNGNQATGGADPLGQSRNPSISADGRFVAFESKATNLVPNDTNGQSDVFVHNRQTGQTVRVSIDSGGAEGSSASGGPSISADGRFVAFWSVATNLVPNDNNNARDVFVHDRDTDGNGVFDEAGAISTTRVSVTMDGTEGNAISNSAVGSISGDGRFVAFVSTASNLVASDTNGFQDVFVHDSLTGQTVRVSVDINGGQANGTSGLGNLGKVSISFDGKFVVFDSDASNLVPNDTNGFTDVFIARTGF